MKSVMFLLMVAKFFLQMYNIHIIHGICNGLYVPLVFMPVHIDFEVAMHTVL